MFKILIIEDDKDLCKSIRSYLNNNGYEATGVHDAASAYNCMHSEIFDLIISDIMLPGTDGYEIAKTIRATNKNIPILFASAKHDMFSKKKAFQVEIDDYLVKPFDIEELRLRIEAVLRRSKIASSRKLTVGSLTMNMDERTAILNGKEIFLTVREFNILYKLLSYPQKTFTRFQLMEEFWDSETTSGTRTVDVYVTKLRNKLSECKDFEIITVHGLGYKAVIK